MSDARKRKLQSSLAKSTELPESLRFVPSVEAPTNGPHTKRQKTTVHESLPRTAHELGLLNLQSHQLLKTLRRKDTRDINLTKLITSITSQIKAIPEAKSAKLGDLRQRSKAAGVSIPFIHEPPEDLQLNFEFLTVEGITDLSALSIDLLPRSASSIALLAVELPAAAVQDKDYLNHRIHYKISFYLYTIAISLKSKYEFAYGFHKIFGTKRPVLHIRYKDREVILHMVLPNDVFDESKLDVAKNADRSINGPSPKYNTDVLLLSRHIEFFNLIQDTILDSSGLSESILLAGKYLSTRQLPLELDQWGLVTTSLLHGGGKNGGKVLSPNASALQLFRGTLLFLSQFFASTAGSTSFSGNHAEPGCWTHGINIFSNMTEQQGSLLAREFGIAVKLMVDDSRNSIKAFERVFLEKRNFLGLFDLEFQIPLAQYTVIDVERMWRTLRKALGTRASLVCVSQPFSEQPSPIKEILSILPREQVVVQICLNREDAQAKMILGPPANAPEAQAFRSFWGYHAELRKFKDGRILESVILEANNPSIDACKRILSLHFPDLPTSDSWSMFGEEDPNVHACVLYQQTLAAEFDEFARIARDLEGLPLRITAVSSADPIFFHCSATVPAIVEGVIRFESSGRWPDDLQAIQRTKVAILLALRKPFSTVSGVADVRVGLENQPSTALSTITLSIINCAFVEVTMSSGVSYRLRVHLDREDTLLTTYLKSAQAKSDSHRRRQYQAALDLYRKTFVTSDLHLQTMMHMKSRFPAFPECTILLKRWFTAHLLDSHFSQSIIDLISLDVFVNDLESNVQTPTSAFFRTMRYLASWDWRQDPLILTEDPELYSTNVALFDQIKAQNIGHSLVVYPPYSAPAGTVEKVSALLMTVLAKASHDKLQAGDSVASTLRSRMDYFDLVIDLVHRDVGVPKYKNLQPAASGEAEVAKKFKMELEQIYAGVLHLFTSPGMSQIGVLVDPVLHESRNFRPNLGYPTKPVKSDIGQKVSIDLDSIVREIERLGEGLIKRILRK